MRSSKIGRDKLFIIGGVCMFVGVMAVFVTVALFMNAKTAGYVSAAGTVLSYQEKYGEDSDGNTTLLYAPVVRYEYEGITYTEISSSSSSIKNYEVGETVEIEINPLEPSEFALKSDRSFVWIILGFVAVVAYILTVFLGLVPLLTKKRPFCNWGGLLGSTVFIIFPAFLTFSVAAATGAGNLFELIAKMPFVAVFLLFAAFGVFGFIYELIRVAQLLRYEKRDPEKFEKILQKEQRRFKKSGKMTVSVLRLADKAGYPTDIGAENPAQNELDRLEYAKLKRDLEAVGADSGETAEAKAEDKHAAEGKFEYLNRRYAENQADEKRRKKRRY